MGVYNANNWVPLEIFVDRYFDQSIGDHTYSLFADGAHVFVEHLADNVPGPHGYQSFMLFGDDLVVDNGVLTGGTIDGVRFLNDWSRFRGRLGQTAIDATDFQAALDAGLGGDAQPMTDLLGDAFNTVRGTDQREIFPDSPAYDLSVVRLMGGDDDYVASADPAAPGESRLIDGGAGLDYFQARETLGGIAVSLEAERFIDAGGTVHRLRGFERVWAGNGDDTLIGSETETNAMFGHTGNDILRGGGLVDGLRGNDGDDLLIGLRAGDNLWGDRGDDTLLGGIGRDLADGGDGNDSLDGGLGNDTLRGRDGDDTLVGGAGRDRLAGGGRDDLLIGGADDDYLLGNFGRDTLFGDAGDDTIYGGGGRDLLSGGAGADLFQFRTDEDATQVTRPDEILDFEIGVDRLQLRAFPWVQLEVNLLGTFSADGPSLMSFETGGDTTVWIDLDGDQVSDFHLVLRGVTGLTESDFGF